MELESLLKLSNVFNDLLDLLFLGAFDDVIGTRALVGSNEVRVIGSREWDCSFHVVCKQAFLVVFFHNAGDLGFFTWILFLYRTHLQLVVERTFALSDEFVENVKTQLVEGEVDENWYMHVDGRVRFKGRLCVLRDMELGNELLADAHTAKYTIHPRNTKMYQDLKK